MKKVKKVWNSELIKTFTNIAEKWLTKYCLDDWVVVYSFNEESCPKENWDTDTVLATTTADWVYHKATIIFYPEILQNKKSKIFSKYTENCIKHEIAHLLTNKIADLANDRYATAKQIEEEIESLTQKISIVT